MTTVVRLSFSEPRIYRFLPHNYCQETEVIDHFNVNYIPSQLLGWRRQFWGWRSASIKVEYKNLATLKGKPRLLMTGAANQSCQDGLKMDRAAVWELAHGGCWEWRQHMNEAMHSQAYAPR